MNFLDLARERYSVLRYSNRHIEDEVLNRILHAGMLAPTACNFQPQRIKLIRSEADREKLMQTTRCRLYFDTALIVCYDKNECWKRPHDGKLSGEIDASIAATHMILAAADEGVGSIWVMSWSPETMRETFAIPENLEIVALLIMGYADEGESPRPTHYASKEIADILI